MPFKKLWVLAVCLIHLTFAFSQENSVTHWSFHTKKLSDSTYEIHLTATLDEGWHIYSQNTPDGGPLPTSVSWSVNPLVSLDGKTREDGKLQQHLEPLFGVAVMQYSGTVDFVQKMKVRGRAKTAIGGTISFMTCNDKECLPTSTHAFSIALN
jgi:DsbC/DsbD-like thiol-disulfide interchange protein